MTETAIVPLAPVCDLSAAAPLRNALISAVDGGGPVAIDASAVQRLGTPCAQVLLSAERSLAARSGGGESAGASAAFTDAMRDLGLDDALDRWSEA